MSRSPLEDADDAFYKVTLAQRDAAWREIAALKTALALLLERVRPDCEAAPWVVAELRAIVEGKR